MQAQYAVRNPHLRAIDIRDREDDHFQRKHLRGTNCIIARSFFYNFPSPLTLGFDQAYVGSGATTARSPSYPLL
jgi:hypothetical protein